MTKDSNIQMSDQLYELSVEQAKEVLDAFLRVEGEEFPKIQIGIIDLDYSPQSVIFALRYIAGEIGARRFDEEQRHLWFARLGYYLGESLRRANPSLRWGLGDPEYAFANHPVITGFSNDEEA